MTDAPKEIGLAPARPWYFDVAILLAAAPLIFSAVRVWLYAGGDTAVFLTLVRTLDLPTVLVGTLAVLAQGALLLFFTMVFLDWRVRDIFRTWLQRPWSSSLTAVVLIVFVITGNVMFWAGLASLAALIGLYFLVKHIPGGKRLTKWVVPPRGERSDTSVVVVSVAITLLMLPTNMWLPLEQVTLANKSTEQSYVLQVSSEWTTTLTKDRKIRTYPTTDVVDRETCRSAVNGTLGAVLFQVPIDADAPKCS